MPQKKRRRSLNKCIVHLDDVLSLMLDYCIQQNTPLHYSFVHTKVNRYFVQKKLSVDLTDMLYNVSFFVVSAGAVAGAS